MIFSAGRRAACSNSSGVLTWHRAGWKQLTPASTSALPLFLHVVLPPAHRQTLQPLLMDPQVTRVCQMGTNPPPQNCLGADWFLWKGLIGFYNDISTVQMSYKKKELLLLLMIISGDTPRTEESPCSLGGSLLDGISTEWEQKMLSLVVVVAF